MTKRNQDQKQQPFIQKFFTRKERNGNKVNRAFHALEIVSDSFDDSLYCGEEESSMLSNQYTQNLRVFVATWNVGGKYPHSGLNLDDFLQVNNQADIYVLGFQEIVPLNAGNVLVIEDNQPAARWLVLINNSLNKSHDTASRGRQHASTYGGLFFSKPSLKKISKTFKTEKGRKLKSCNCSLELERKASKDLCFRCQDSYTSEDDSSSGADEDIPQISLAPDGKNIKYSLIASKQMVGIFVSIWMRKELVQHVGHLRISCISRGIMGCLGNKGCISVSFSFCRTTFCFICSHLASGEKEGDELRRNLDVIEILKNTQFPRICKTTYSKMPERILDHDRIIWIGDLNYRIALSYSVTKKLLEQNAWDALLQKDQLKIEREAGRVFSGWKEGNIYFPPTYKYFFNSDNYYADEIKNSKIKRRTPAWCDRILWHGNGIRQLYYVRGESRFSDHRPVCAEFLVEVEVPSGRLRNKYNTKVGIEELLP